jgi:myosin heavy subunit
MAKKTKQAVTKEKEKEVVEDAKVLTKEREENEDQVYQTLLEEKEVLDEEIKQIQQQYEQIALENKEQNKEIGRLQAEIEVLGKETKQQKGIGEVLAGKNESLKEKLDEHLKQMEKLALEENETILALEEKLRKIETENTVLSEKNERYQDEKEILLEQSEEIEEEREELEIEKKEWNQLLNDLDIQEASSLKSELKILRAMNNKLKEQLRHLENEFSSYKENAEINENWVTEKEALEEELELIRKDLQFYKESEIQWESISRLQTDYRYQHEQLTAFQQEVETLQQEKYDLQDENNRLQKQQDEYEKVKNLSEFYRLRSRNLEEEIKRLRKIEEDSAADETKIFENFNKILETSVKTENQTEEYPGDDTIALRVKNLSKKANFHFSDEMIHGFLASMRSSRFMILKGLSGTGKTSLPRIMAYALGGVCETIPVQPSWKSKTDLIGFYNHFNSRFLATPFTEALFKAQLPENRNKFYFITLDEMNLARVEYYFSDFNSKLELEKEKQVIELFDSPGKTSGDVNEYIIDGNKLAIPPNVFFIGTINDDESTYSLSDKIYDRAQVLDFQEVTDDSIGDMEKVEPMPPVDFFSYSHRYEEISNLDVQKEMKTLEEVFTLLKDEFLINLGHRPRRQMKVFLQTYKGTSKWDTVEGIDTQIISKILPKIRFSFDDKFEENVDNLGTIIAKRLSKKAASLQALERIKRGL